MINRFKGDAGTKRLVSAIRRQKVIHDSIDLASAFAEKVEVLQFESGENFINQNEIDDDLFFILSGRVSITVNGREVAVRYAGQHVGEMVLIDPSARRSASVIAIDQTVVAKISESDFSYIAANDPRLWRLVSAELCERLRERNHLVRPTNPRPVLFIGSSSETLPIARELRSGLSHDDILVKLWTDGGVFGASRFPIEDLATQVGRSDFAVLVVGPDDKIESRGKISDGPRDNVIFELGLFMGALSRKRTFLVMPKGLKIKIPTDLLGINIMTFNSTINLDDLSSQIGPICDELRKTISKNGPR